jgi:hypothetical protein
LSPRFLQTPASQGFMCFIDSARFGSDLPSTTFRGILVLQFDSFFGGVLPIARSKWAVIQSVEFQSLPLRRLKASAGM